MTTPGMYEVVSNVAIRREPRVIEYRDGDNKLVSNQVGVLTVGTHRKVYSVVTNKDNSTWGRVSEADAAGIAQWVCIQGLNRTYMKQISVELEAKEDTVEVRPQDILLAQHETRIKQLEVWARTKGYTG